MFDYVASLSPSTRLCLSQFVRKTPQCKKWLEIVRIKNQDITSELESVEIVSHILFRLRATAHYISNFRQFHRQSFVVLVGISRIRVCNVLNIFAVIVLPMWKIYVLVNSNVCCRRVWRSPFSTQSSYMLCVSVVCVALCPGRRR